MVVAFSTYWQEYSGTTKSHTTVHSSKQRTEVFREDNWKTPNKTTEEQVYIYVRMRTTETHRNSDSKEIKYNEFLCAFLSQVADPDRVDWRIAGVAQFIDPS